MGFGPFSIRGAPYENWVFWETPNFVESLRNCSVCQLRAFIYRLNLFEVWISSCWSEKNGGLRGKSLTV